VTTTLDVTARETHSLGELEIKLKWSVDAYGTFTPNDDDWRILSVGLTVKFSTLDTCTNSDCTTTI